VFDMRSDDGITPLAAEGLILPNQLNWDPLPIHPDLLRMAVRHGEERPQLFLAQVGLKFPKDLPGDHNRKLPQAV